MQTVVNSQGAALQFKRSLYGILYTELDLLAIVSHISFTHLEDKLSWRWDPQGKFTVKSLYQFLNFRGVKPRNAMLWWKIPIPLKIRIFMWLTSKNRILTTDNLIKRGWQGCDKCQFCDQPETINHLFFTCSFTKQIWFYLGACQQVSCKWTKLSDVVHFARQLPSKQKIALLLVCSSVCWTLWKHRNELCFGTGKKKTHRQLILLIISLVHYWSGQVKQEIKDNTSLWLPADLDVLPIATWHPKDDDADTTQDFDETPELRIVAG